MMSLVNTMLSLLLLPGCVNGGSDATEKRCSLTVGLNRADHEQSVHKTELGDQGVKGFGAIAGFFSHGHKGGIGHFG